MYAGVGRTGVSPAASGHRQSRLSQHEPAKIKDYFRMSAGRELLYLREVTALILIYRGSKGRPGWAS